MKKLLIRTISGILFVAIIVLGTLWTEWSFLGLWVIIGVLSIWEYSNLVKHADVIKDKSCAQIMGASYIGIPIFLVTQIEPMMVITLLTIVWINDTGAFIVGSTIGKHKMAPSISPKKSWEGFFGGVIFAVGASVVWYSLYWSQSMPDAKIEWLGFGIVVAIAAVAGDLVESKFKRFIGVKDSGTMIPGHGGILDRMDASLLAIPFAWLYVVILFHS